LIKPGNLLPDVVLQTEVFFFSPTAYTEKLNLIGVFIPGSRVSIPATTPDDHAAQSVRMTV
jgi:hypothetical protein